MAVFQKETGLCTGRGFADVDAAGYLAKLKTWIVKAPASGGPGWTILLDKTTLPVLTPEPRFSHRTLTGCTPARFSR